MKSLKWLRGQGEMMNQEELDLFVPLTIQQSVSEFLIIYNSVALMLDELRDLDREQDEIYFTEMAKRLERVRKQRFQHGKPVSQRRTLPEAS